MDSDGYFIEPTIFTTTDNSLSIVQEEIFGPVLTILPFESEDEVLSFANDNIYGLASSIWTKDISRAHRLIPQVQAGTVWVNTHDLVDSAMPFGGVKESGFGKDMGPEQLAHFQSTKAVWLQL